MPATVKITVTTSVQVNVSVQEISGCIERNDSKAITLALMKARQDSNCDDVMQMRLNMLEYQIKQGRPLGIQQALGRCIHAARADQWKLRQKKQQAEMKLRCQLKKRGKHGRKPGRITCKKLTVTTITTKITYIQQKSFKIDELYALHRMCLFDKELAAFLEDMIDKKERGEDLRDLVAGLLLLLSAEAWEKREAQRQKEMDAFNKLREAGQEAIEEFFDAAEDFAEDCFEFIGMTAKHLDDTMDQWSNKIDDFADQAQEEIEEFSDDFDDAIDDARREIEETMDEIKEGLDDLAESLTAFLTDVKAIKDEIVDFYLILTSINPIEVLETFIRRIAWKLEFYYGSLKFLTFLDAIADAQARGLAILTFFITIQTFFLLFLGTDALVTLFMYPIPMIETVGIIVSNHPTKTRIMKYWLTYWIIIAGLNLADLVGFLDLLYYPNVFQIVFCYWLWGNPWGARTMYRRLFKNVDIMKITGIKPRTGDIDDYALDRACPYRRQKQD